MTGARLDDDPAGATAERERDRHGIVRLVEVACLGVGVLLVGALFFQYLDVYLAFFGEQSVATDADGTRYLVTAGACVVLLAAGTITAAAARHHVVAGLGVVLVLVGFAAAGVLAVPVDRWTIDPPVVERAPGPPACRSGGDSDECPGG